MKQRILSFRVTDKEYAEILKMAARAGKNLSDFIRDKVHQPDGMVTYSDSAHSPTYFQADFYDAPYTTNNSSYSLTLRYHQYPENPNKS